MPNRALLAGYVVFLLLGFFVAVALNAPRGSAPLPDSLSGADVISESVEND